MAALRWTPARMDQLEHAVRTGRRVAVSRRGTEFIVVPLRVTHEGSRDLLVARLPMTGEELRFSLDELDGFQALP